MPFFYLCSIVFLNPHIQQTIKNMTVQEAKLNKDKHPSLHFRLKAEKV